MSRPDPSLPCSQVADLLALNLDLDLIAVLRFGCAGGALRYGPCQAWAQVAGLDATALARLEGRCARAWQGPLSRPPQRSRGRFVSLESLVGEGAAAALLGELGCRCAHALLVYDGTRLAGCVLAARCDAHGELASPELRRISGLVPSIEFELIQGSRAERHRGERLPGTLLFAADGSLRASADGGDDALDAELLAVLSRHVRAAHQGQHLGERALVHGLQIEVLRLNSQDGLAPRYLVHLAPAAAVELSPDALLTPSQRRIAALLCGGATQVEIASHLGVSVNTVKTHLRTAYRVLGVSSRVELVEALREAPPPGN